MEIIERFHPLNTLRPEEVCALAGISASGLAKIVKSGYAPPPIKYGPNCLRYRADEIAAWVATYRYGERRKKKRSRMARAPEA
jgi:predicted DNA-binding transcriptional regulator AlpA